jgi:hypothetical protein
VLTRKQSQTVFVGLMCIVMAGLATLVLHFIQHGFDHPVGFFISRWLKDWVIAAIVMMVGWIFVGPVVHKIVDSFTS